MPSSPEDLKIKFIELLKDTTSNKVIQLYGRWGIGKTYLLNEVIKEIEPSLKKKVIKVSLFDKNSISELKEDILMQVYSYNKTLNRYANHMDAVQNVITKTFAGVTVSSLSSLLKAKDFKEVIISFDDIERRNKDFNFDTFLGFISILKDDKNCDVILILNYDQLDDEDKIIFDKYKEKVIDYNLILNRSSSEALEIALSSNTDMNFRTEFQSVVESIGLNNIRLIHHMIKMVKQLKNIDFESYNPEIIKLFITGYMYYAYLYFKYGIDDIDSILSYQFSRNIYNTTKKMLNEQGRDEELEDEVKVDEHELYNSILTEINLSHIFEIFSKEINFLLDDIMKSHYISNNNIERLKENLSSLSKSKDQLLTVQKINQLRLDYLSDMTNGIEYYYQDIIQEIKKYEVVIASMIGLKTFFYTLDFLKKHNVIEVQELEKRCINYYITWLIEDEKTSLKDLNAFGLDSPLDELKQRNIDYFDLYNKDKKDSIPEQTNDVISKTILKLKNNEGIYKNNLYTINSFTSEVLYFYMKSSPENMMIIIMYLKRHKNQSDTEPFTEKSHQSLIKIYKESSDEIKQKIAIIFSYKEDKDILEKITSA